MESNTGIVQLYYWKGAIADTKTPVSVRVCGAVSNDISV